MLCKQGRLARLLDLLRDCAAITFPPRLQEVLLGVHGELQGLCYSAHRFSSPAPGSAGKRAAQRIPFSSLYTTERDRRRELKVQCAALREALRAVRERNCMAQEDVRGLRALLFRAQERLERTSAALQSVSTRYHELEDVAQRQRVEYDGLRSSMTRELTNMRHTQMRLQRQLADLKQFKLSQDALRYSFLELTRRRKCEPSGTG